MFRYEVASLDKLNVITEMFPANLLRSANFLQISELTNTPSELLRESSDGSKQ